MPRRGCSTNPVTNMITVPTTITTCLQVERAGDRRARSPLPCRSGRPPLREEEAKRVGRRTQVGDQGDCSEGSASPIFLKLVRLNGRQCQAGLPLLLLGLRLTF